MKYSPFAYLSFAGTFLFVLSACASRGSQVELPPSVVLPEAVSIESIPEEERLRGSITPEREWWNVLHYDLKVAVDLESKSIRGSNTVKLQALRPGKRLQIDLQEPMTLTRALHRGKEIEFEREGDVYWIQLGWTLSAGAKDEVELFFEGTPPVSERPPWSGGFTWETDSEGHPFIATTCQGAGASLWWPNKDHGYDEPDQGMRIQVSVPDSLVAVANGRLTNTQVDPTNRLKIYHWEVTQPINNYCVNVNIGNYVAIDGSYASESGHLDTQYWVLEHEEERARRHFAEVPRTLEAFEYWFGPYPFPEDSYKLVSVPYLGMEHQSSVTYGNGFENGYLGRDLSDTGVGLKFDYIIIHETAHEWFGNNISMKDTADMWIHESFATYAEGLFVEYHFGEDQASEYTVGTRKRIRNDKPIIGTYGANRAGSGDMYNKGANMLNTLRYALNDTERWRNILRGMNQEFRHRTISTINMERYLTEQTELPLGPFFDQYLRTTSIPKVRWEPTEKGVRLWFENVVADFRLPVTLHVDGQPKHVDLSAQPREFSLPSPLQDIQLDRNFYMEFERATDSEVGE